MAELGGQPRLTFDHEQIKGVKVSDVIATLKKHGRNHLLVVDGGPGPAAPRVTGVISRAQIERQLGSVIDMVEIAESFAEIGQALS